MNKSLKRWLAVLVAAVLVIGMGYFTMDGRLKASDEDGNGSATEQQAEKKAVEVKVEKKEEPKAEEKKEEPKAEEKKEEPKAEEPKAEEKKEESKAEEKVTETAEAEKNDVPAEENATEAVTATEATEASEVTAEPEAKETKNEFNGDVHIVMLNKGQLYYGDTVTLRAMVDDTDCDYKLRWEMSTPSGWKSVDCSSRDYTFTVTKENADAQYRVVVIP